MHAKKDFKGTEKRNSEYLMPKTGQMKRLTNSIMRLILLDL